MLQINYNLCKSWPLSPACLTLSQPEIHTNVCLCVLILPLQRRQQSLASGETNSAVKLKRSICYNYCTCSVIDEEDFLPSWQANSKPIEVAQYGLLTQTAFIYLWCISTIRLEDISLFLGDLTHPHTAPAAAAAAAENFQRPWQSSCLLIFYFFT